jgi:hypothetical protein
MRSKLLIALCALSCGTVAGSATAQIIEPLVPLPVLPTGPQAPPQPGQPTIVGKTVTDRARPELDPLGMHFGQFFFFPRAEIDEGYNDNIFATSSGRQGAWVTQFVPSFDLLSNFRQGALQVSGGAALGRYASHSSENFDDAFGLVGGRLDVSALTHVLASARFERLHEPRTSPDSPGGASTPVRYSVGTGKLGLTQTGTRLGYEADAIITRSDYEAVPAFGGGFIAQSDRNVTGYEGALRLNYELKPDYQAFVRGSGNTQQFDHAAGNGIPTRDSDGYRIDVGARVDLTGVTYAELYVGYLNQDFRASSFGTISGIDYGASVVWNFSTLDTAKFGATRTVNNANAAVVGTATSPGYLASVETISLDHELLRNVLLNANASYEEDDWKNISRNDHVYGLGAGAKYLMNRNLYLGATWNFYKRNSSGTAQGVSFYQNIFLLRLSTQL